MQLIFTPMIMRLIERRNESLARRTQRSTHVLLEPTF
jgi:hypothetical protein